MADLERKFDIRVSPVDLGRTYGWHLDRIRERAQALEDSFSIRSFFEKNGIRFNETEKGDFEKMLFVYRIKMLSLDNSHLTLEAQPDEARGYPRKRTTIQVDSSRRPTRGVAALCMVTTALSKEDWGRDEKEDYFGEVRNVHAASMDAGGIFKFRYTSDGFDKQLKINVTSGKIEDRFF